MDNSKNIDKLKGILGFDPGAKPSLSGNLFKEVVEEITQERTKTAKAQAKELLVQAMALQEKWGKASAAFKTEEAKFEKELGTLLKKVNSQLEGTSATTEEAPGEGPETADKPA